MKRDSTRCPTCRSKLSVDIISDKCLTIRDFGPIYPRVCLECGCVYVDGNTLDRICITLAGEPEEEEEEE